MDDIPEYSMEKVNPDDMPDICSNPDIAKITFGEFRQSEDFVVDIEIHDDKDDKFKNMIIEEGRKHITDDQLFEIGFVYILKKSLDHFKNNPETLKELQDKQKDNVLNEE